MNIYTHFVYWIYLEEHHDTHTQGYVGVTDNPDKRFKEHLKESKSSSPKNIHLARALSKYSVRRTLLFQGTKEACYDFEFDLRPNRNIGWNIQKGGKIITDANIQKRSNSLTDIQRSEDWKNNLSKSKMGSNNPRHGIKEDSELTHIRTMSMKRSKNAKNYDTYKKAIVLMNDGKSADVVSKELCLNRGVCFRLKNRSHGFFEIFPELM